MPNIILTIMMLLVPTGIKRANLVKAMPILTLICIVKIKKFVTVGIVSITAILNISL
jgi:hypothetical protein